MNELNNNLSFYGSYFRGVQDILEFRSAQQAALGAFKILSGFTILPLIIFGLGWLITQNELHKLESLCDRVSKALKPEGNAEMLTQNDLITFLSKSVLDHDQNKTEFDIAFERLNSNSEKILFASMADKGKLVDSLARVPVTIREINVGLGRDPSIEMIDETITQLCIFKQLHTITFDLSETTYYTTGVQSLITRGINLINLNANFASSSKQSFDLHNDRVLVSGGSCPNNSLPAFHIIQGVVYKLIKESALAKINFSFKINRGELCPVFIANPSRLAKISEQDAKKDSESNLLNNLRPLPNAKDLWIAQT